MNNLKRISIIYPCNFFGHPSNTKIVQRYIFNYEKTFSSMIMFREFLTKKKSFSTYKEYLGNTNKSNIKKSTQKKFNSSTRLRIQKREWMSNKVDEIKRENECEEKKKTDINETKNQYNFTEDNQYEIRNRELIPLHLIDYETQVKIKMRRLELYIKRFVNLIKDYSSTIILDSKNHPCVIYDLIRSDLLDEYRSQDEFQIGLNVKKSITVGSMFGSFKNGNLICIPPDKFIVCKESHRLLAKKFEYYIKEKSQLTVCLDYKSKYGNWISFFVRSNQNGEHQCLIKLNSQKLSEKELNEERKLLIDYFQSIVKEIKIKSLSLEILKINRNHINGEKESNQISIEHLFGNPHIPIEFRNNTYYISIKSMFPLNVQAYNKMIDFVIENLDLTSKQNVIYVNPYSGLGLVELSQSVNKLFVLHKTEQQAQDTKKSFEHFKKKFTEKIHIRSGNMTKNLFRILDSNTMEINVIIKQEDLTYQMLNELRDNANVSKIVIISTKAEEELMKFWVYLCLDNKNNISNGNPFNFISATPIDSHPHSNIYTIVSIFERIIV